MHYYEVAPNKIVRKTVHFFTYSSKSSLDLGSIVHIPVGKQILTGIILKKVPKPDFVTKPILDSLATPPLPMPLLKTLLWMSDYYSAPLANVLQTVLPRGIDKQRRERIDRPFISSRKRTNFVLNDDQFNAVNSIIGSAKNTLLLHGITGSGKTAVYIESAKNFISQGKSIIVLVPEISLAPQLVNEFMNHFQNVYLSHSKQTEAERHITWNNIAKSQQPVIAIGPRSALFMPIQNLGAIFIDEEHEPSYKQEKTPRYSAIRVASVLANMHNAIAILGSATPSITDYYIASKQSSIISLPKSAISSNIKPEVKLVDMTQKTVGFTRSSIISDKLLEASDKTLEDRHQVLFFHNRRGSASTTLCENCGWISICNRCLIPHTLHSDKHLLQCHLCGIKVKIPTACPDCHGTNIIHKGIGTKRIEEELKKIYPNKKIARFDGDTNDASTLDSRYNDLYSGAIDIIIGTQVVAKGLDLPNLRTVGIIQADTGLGLPDYISSERAFQLIAQTVGRVGRSRHKTSVVVQTYQPSHFSIQYGITQDFMSFYNMCLSERKRASFPPFVHMLKLTCIYKTEKSAIKNSQLVALSIRAKHGSHVSIFGPSPAFYERQNGTYRWQIIVKSTTRSILQDIIKTIPDSHWQFELDPGSLL